MIKNLFVVLNHRQRFFTVGDFKKSQMNIIKLLFVLLFLVSCKKNNEFEVKSFQANDGWGYTIGINDKTIIKQSVVPTVSNRESFKSEEDALKVGNLVLDRIKHNLSPTVSKKDLILLEISI
jgi:hypothetical protein